MDKTLKNHILSTVRAFDLILKLRARPKYQLLFVTNKSTRFTAYLSCGLDFCLNQQLWVLCSPCRPLSTTVKVVTVHPVKL